VIIWNASPISGIPKDILERRDGRARPATELDYGLTAERFPPCSTLLLNSSGVDEPFWL